MQHTLLALTRFQPDGLNFNPCITVVNKGAEMHFQEN